MSQEMPLTQKIVNIRAQLLVILQTRMKACITSFAEMEKKRHVHIGNTMSDEEQQMFV